MGNQQNKARVLNPGEIVIQQPQQDSQFESFLKEEFHKSASNGYLGKDKFNEALAVIENFQIKRLRNTPLGDRLFVIFDGTKANKVREVDCVQNLTDLIKDKDVRIQYTFKAINKEQNNKISRWEFQEFYEESWKAAFRILGEKVQKKGTYQNIGVTKINNWATLQLESLKKEINAIFSQIDKTNKGFIDFPTFKEWIKKTEFHSIIATFDDLSVEIPTDLYEIDLPK